jgi:uncharacterized protein (TIGR03435 family)
MLFPNERICSHSVKLMKILCPNTALEEPLGLRLESQKGPVEMFMVERVERPSPN